MSSRGVAIFVLAIALAACSSSREPLPAEHVPSVWRDVRTSAGHLVHVGKVACARCHGDTGFAPPPAELCAGCHAKTTPLHHDDPTAARGAPRCTECHGYSADLTIKPWNCIRCHAQAQNHVAAVGAHADEACGDCHHPHATPATTSKPCTECHADRATSHAGLHGCRDCHDVHEPTRVTGRLPGLGAPPPHAGAAARCESCHANQPGALHVDARAYSAGHTACTTCHQPHQFKPRACADCHANQPVIAAAPHTCLGCHAPHDGGRARACTTCHAQPAAHPNTTHALEGNCVGCHPPHDRGHLAQAGHHAAVACISCHAAHPSHATAACLDCHQPHGAKPQATGALCTRCHADQVRSTADTGHARCITCHVSAAHAPAIKPPVCATCHATEASAARGGHAVCATCHAAHAPRPTKQCATCHAAEASSAPPGHAACATCHSVHAPKPTKVCATCHQSEAASPHGTQVACVTCHRPHGPGGVATPPACATCHAADKRKGLHASHLTCASCHSSHAPHPRDDRATCIGACHKDRVAHEPTATHCATCHPFK